MGSDQPTGMPRRATRQTTPSRPGAAAVMFWIVSIVAAFTAASSIAEDAERAPAPTDAGTASPAELEVLRRLLGLPSSEPGDAHPAASQPAASQPAASRPAASHPAASQPAVSQPASQSASQPVAPSEESAEEEAVREQASDAPALPSARPKTLPTRAPAPSKKVLEPEPSRARRVEKPAAAPASSSTTSSTQVVPSTTAPVTTEAPPAQTQQKAGSASPVAGQVAIPAAGTVVARANLDDWRHLLGPSMQWSVERGATLEVVDPKPMPLEPARAEATRRYHAQVTLAADRRSMRDYVAGIPFPLVDGNDPDAGPKMMFNMEHRIVQDDLDARNFRCDTGTLDPKQGFEIQRSYLIDHFRRLYSVGRLWVDPKPVMPDPEGARYREMLYPIREPFDLKGAGFTYIRFLDPNRQDDSWLYFPQLKRVRRLSTAQRSEGIFGQDVDLDSYGGFAGNPAWTSWTYLGRKTLLTSMHARATTDKFQDKPADFFPRDVWEPRDVHVILGISQLGGYNFGRRILYLDAENWIVPYTEIYDLTGELWRSLIHTWKGADRPRPDAKRAVYDYETIFINSFTLVDMQQEHATRCQFPSPDMPDEDGWYYVFGDAEGTTREEFSVTNFVGSGR
jgi:hypothetical protein